MSQITNVLEAYRLILEAAEELRATGIGLKIKPSKSTNSRPDDELPRDKWVVIRFKVANKEQSDAVRQRCKELGWRGIRFDTSGCVGERDWEVDWSFKLTPSDGEWEAAGDEVEDIIDGCERGDHPSQSH